MDKDRVLPFAADSRFFHKRAVRSMDKQDFLTALKHLKRALDMDPGSAEIALDLADTYARMGLYEMSNVELELLLGRQDCPEETQFAIGCNLMAMGDYAQAYVCFSAYLHDHPEGEFAYLAQDGIAQIEESEEEDGIDREQEALAEQGKAALDGGDAERAAEIFERVLAQDPSLLYVRNNLALAYMCLQDSPNAWKQLNRILQTEANNTHACCNAALLMNNEGRADQAAAYMARLNPELMEELDELYKYCLTAAELRMQPELVKAACDKAHSLGMIVAAHVESPEGVMAALQNGVDSIEHGAQPNDEMITLFKQRKAFQISTISPALPYALFDRSISHATYEQQENGKIVFDGIVALAKANLAAGVPVGLGTDVGCPYITHYDMWRELHYFVKYCGVTPAFALYSATKLNARLAGIGDLTGSIEADKQADLIVCSGNPLQNLSALRELDMVVKGCYRIDKPQIKKMDEVERELDKFL